ncbi:MAG: FAD-dependent monooxygenase [Pseudomonadota bacterium]
MQFHLDGFRPGDPDIHDADASATCAANAAEVDVLIVGCGPAGLTLAAQLSAFPDIKTRIVERKSGPLQIGQADGIAVRTVEMFNAFGFAEKVLREAYWVNETVFWRPDPAAPSRIARSKRIQDVEEGLSEFPHVILSQARVHDFYLEVMRNAPGRLTPDYDREVTGLVVDHGARHPVTVTLDRRGEKEVIRARYVVGCDGVRSKVRQAVGLSLVGDQANKAWGIVDALLTTDFPDIRFKAVIQSADEGSVLIIPREGGYMVRIYIEMENLAEGARVASRNITADHLIAAAKRIMAPYSIDVKEVAWWSVYEIGQRLTDRFDNGGDGRAPCVFIAGDACHTHSPKAGQGMNVSMGDAFNLGWKLAAVISGRSPANLLDTYTEERRALAKTLINFDREFAARFSRADKKGEDDPAEFQRCFIKHGRFTAGAAIRYAPSTLTSESGHQALATGFEIGARFHSAPAIRLADGKPMHLGHAISADGRWRLFLFAGAEGPRGADVQRLRAWLADDPASPVRRYTPDGADLDSVFDIRCVIQEGRHNLSLSDAPALLRPAKGRYGLSDYEKIFCADPAADIYDMRAVSRDGCVVVVRPDQHVAHITPLDGAEALAAFFERVMIPPAR